MFSSSSTNFISLLGVAAVLLNVAFSPAVAMEDASNSVTPVIAPTNDSPSSSGSTNVESIKQHAPSSASMISDHDVVPLEHKSPHKSDRPTSSSSAQNGAATLTVMASDIPPVVTTMGRSEVELLSLGHTNEVEEIGEPIRRMAAVNKRSNDPFRAIRMQLDNLRIQRAKTSTRTNTWGDEEEYEDMGTPSKQKRRTMKQFFCRIWVINWFLDCSDPISQTPLGQRLPQYSRL